MTVARSVAPAGRDRVARTVRPRRHGTLGLETKLGRGVPHTDLETLLCRGPAVAALQQLLDNIRRLAVKPTRAVVGSRVGAIVALASNVQAKLLEHLVVFLRARSERRQEVAHHHAVEPGLDRERLQLAKVLDTPAAKTEQRFGKDQTEDG